MVSCPTRIAELIPDREPSTNNACDADAASIGGVHFVPTADSEIPILWRRPFPDWVRTQLLSFKNPKGSITNSDLKLIGSIEQNDILAQAVDYS